MSNEKDKDVQGLSGENPKPDLPPLPPQTAVGGDVSLESGENPQVPLPPTPPQSGK